MWYLLVQMNTNIILITSKKLNKKKEIDIEIMIVNRI